MMKRLVDLEPGDILDHKRIVIGTRPVFFETTGKLWWKKDIYHVKGIEMHPYLGSCYWDTTGDGNRLFEVEDNEVR